MIDSGYSSPTKSVGSDLPPRELLFGEIDTTSSTSTRSLRTNNSICNLILSSSSIFLRFWLVDEIRTTFLDCVADDELPKLRLVCHDFSQKIAPLLFSDLQLTFRASTFTRPSRLAALERIGTHTRSLRVNLPRTQETALPPLINAYGEEASFTYTPQVSSTPSPAAKYGSEEVADLLVKQYPPIFHASTNVPSFVRALGSFPALSQLQVSCPSQGLMQSVRSSVDYALISLRIALERAHLPALETLSFTSIHPEGLFYMQPLHGFGGNPGSIRRWSQIRNMTIHMESFDNDATSRVDQLKTLHNYLRNFATSLTSFHFQWQGEKGPSPMSLTTEPGIFSHDTTYKNDERKRKGLTAIQFTALHHVNVQNAVVDAAQISAFIDQHRGTLEEFRFESIKLRTGDWKEALSPLSKVRHSRKSQMRAEHESMDVPLMLSPQNMTKEPLVDTSIVETNPEEQDDKAEKSPKGICQWLAKAKHRKARVHFKDGSEQVKTFLRRSFQRRRWASEELLQDKANNWRRG